MTSHQSRWKKILTIICVSAGIFTAGTLLMTCHGSTLMEGIGELVERYDLEQIRLNTVALPISSVEPGTYDADLSVELSCATEGASIFYTTDDSVAEADFTAYTAPVAVEGPEATVTLRAYAAKEGMFGSDTAEWEYIVSYELPPPPTPVVSAPSIDFAAGTYNNYMSVTISSSTTGATIVYTTDGSDPKTSGTSVTGTGGSSQASVAVNSSTTLKAYARKTSEDDSETTTAVYTLVAAEPAVTPDDGKLLGTTDQVSLSTATTTAEIRYTTDGSNPDGGSTLYAAPFTLPASRTVKAIAIDPQMTDSNIKSQYCKLQRIYVCAQSGGIESRYLDGTGSMTGGTAGNINLAVDSVNSRVYTATRSPYNDIEEFMLDLTYVGPAISDGGSNLHGVEVDEATGTVFWSDWSSGTVTSTASGIILGGLSGLREIELNSSTNQLYITHQNSTNIYRVNTDGSNLTPINIGIAYAEGLAIDPGDGYLFFTNYDSAPNVWRCNLDGSNVTALSFTGEYPLALDIDTTRKKIYWADDNTGNIRRANYDGTGAETIFTYSGTIIRGMDLDL